MENADTKKYIQPIPADKMSKLQVFLDNQISQRLAGLSAAEALRPVRTDEGAALRMCGCEITLEHIDRACSNYISENIRILLPPKLWVESGNVLNPGEIFAGAVLIFNIGKVMMDHVVFHIGVNNNNALLQVPNSHTCRTSWRPDSPKLQSGTMVSEMFMSIGGFGYGPYYYESIHFAGRAQSAGTFSIYAQVNGKFRLSGISHFSKVHEERHEFEIID